eukprot:CAMPEP_0184674056 /NCGR_PEP_ID=MMETSP0308-20130426/87020_1 /TAXON_ID=38269 /ORGANISM="Gloeochaete witrockiana, Strain SAG 46.84" /LENGTH=256 /DNA_ID=CAMNT_0027121619 /DNA_START=119 /DNA_END=889 /DNA_ORIENTATION=-
MGKVSPKSKKKKSSPAKKSSASDGDFQTSGGKNLFREIDRDGNGYISYRELALAIRNRNRKRVVSQDETRESMLKADVDNNLLIDENEFLEGLSQGLLQVFMMRPTHGAKGTKSSSNDKAGAILDPSERIFREFDNDLNCGLSLSEFRRLIQQLSPSKEDAEIERMFHTVDQDHNGHISLDEFIAAVRTGVLVIDTFGAPKYRTPPVSLNLDNLFSGALDYNCRVAPDRHPLSYWKQVESGQSVLGCTGLQLSGCS